MRTLSKTFMVFACLLVLFCLSSVAQAGLVSLTFTKLTGDVGGSPAATAVFGTDLSSAGIASILSITIQDNSFGLGGSPGQFSGFDLDAIKLSNTSCTTGACAAGAPGLPVFDFTPVGTIFTPGSQRAPADPKLFGTGPTGHTVDNAVATLGLFDGNSTTNVPPGVPPFAFGFVSMGDGGMLSFNLTSSVSTAGLQLYIGEVGDNGEVAAGRITVSDSTVPEPSTLFLLGSGLAGLAGVAWRHRKR